MFYETEEIYKLKEIIGKKDNEIKELKENENQLKDAIVKCNTLIEHIEECYYDIKNFNILKNSKVYYQQLVYLTSLLNEEMQPLYEFMLDSDYFCTNEDFNENEA